MESEDTLQKKSFTERLKRKYRLIIYKDEDYQPIFQMSYSKYKFVTFWTITILLFIGIIYVSIAYTPVRELIPGYPTTSMKHIMISNRMMVDSIEHAMILRDQYYLGLKNAVMGKEGIGVENLPDSIYREEDYSTFNLYAEAENTPPAEEPHNYSYYSNNDKKISSNISSLHFFTPVKGMVTNKFNSQESHFGTDIVASSEEVVKAILPGTVILATWTIETGHVIQLQHDHNIVSFYKHNAELLKKVGMHVDAGEPIAIIGNSGELTTGVHLHFELWHNMIPIDPEDFIKF